MSKATQRNGQSKAQIARRHIARVGTSVLLLAASGLAITAAPSQAAKWYGNSYNRVGNCYSAIVGSNDLMNAGAFCVKTETRRFTLFTKEKGDTGEWVAGGYNRINNCYKHIRESNSLMAQQGSCIWRYAFYMIHLNTGPYNG